LSRGSGQPNISQDIIRFLKLPSPPHNEQKKITNYLDHKTCLIDAIIEKKQKQIELLQEQRTGVINQAVTKGLNPTVKMENTWIEWLCEVPEHWEIKRLKNISKIRYGLGQPPKEQDGGLPLIRATNIKRGRVVENGMVYVNPDDVPYDRDPILRTDDIVVVRSGAYTADSAIIPEQYDGAIVGYDMVVKIYTAIPKLISYALLSSYVLENQLFLKRLRAAQPHLNAEELGETIILIPPDIEEQRGILIFIETKSYQIDRLISRTEKQIELLKEYRITLISEVVTGKIDVRDEVIP
jgi:type I restriction enzyme S subunit